MAQPEFYQQAGEKIAEENRRLKKMEQDLSAAMERWIVLEELVK